MLSRSHKRFTVGLTSAVAFFIIIGCGGAEAVVPGTSAADSSATPVSTVSTISETEARIWLEAPTGIHQTGWASMWEENGSLFVDIDVVPASAVAQPAHIHQGNCTALGVIDIRLENIVGGRSLSELPGITLKGVAAGDLAINLHASFDNFSTFTACGGIPSLGSEGKISPIEPSESDFTESGYDY